MIARFHYLWLFFCPALLLRAEERGAATVYPSGSPIIESKDAAQPAAALPDYIRYVNDADSARLEIPIKSFRLTDGRMVDLVGVVHIADSAYYADLNKRFDAYDAVLFELVGDPALLKLTKQERQRRTEGNQTGIIRMIYNFVGNSLKLSFQLNEIDYTKPNMVHADTSESEFAALQKQRGESMMGLMLRSMQMQLRGELTEETAAMEELDAVGLLRIMMSDDSSGDFKRILARTFDQSEKLGAKMEGAEGTAILKDRNEVALKKLAVVLEDATKKHVCIFYGALHLPSMEKTLCETLKATPVGETWLAAWTMPHAPAKPGSASDKPVPTPSENIPPPVLIKK